MTSEPGRCVRCLLSMMQTLAFALLMASAPAAAAGDDVVIVPRKEWDPSPRARGFRYAGRLKDAYTTIVIHHSDFQEPPGPLGIKDYHLQVSGFSDIGYHFVISPDGTIYEGRPLDRMGAHAGITREAKSDPRKDPDWGSLGIVLDGLFTVDAPPPEQLAALDALLASLRKRFPKVVRVIGHREVRAWAESRGLHPIGELKDCPGDGLFAHIVGTREQHPAGDAAP